MFTFRKLAKVSATNKLPVASFSSIELFSPFSKSQFLSNTDSVPLSRRIDPNIKKHYAVLVPLVDLSGEPGLLFTKRSSNLSSHKGLVSFPGGGMEEGDSSLVETALREAWEEVGIDREKVDIWGQMQPVPTRIHAGDGLVTPVVAVVRQELGDLTMNRGEVKEIFTVKLSRLCDPKYQGYTQFRIGADARAGFSLPIYSGGPHPIWGLTGVMTYQFLSALLCDLYSHDVEKQTDVRELFSMQ